MRALPLLFLVLLALPGRSAVRAESVPLEVARKVEAGEVREALAAAQTLAGSRGEALFWSSWVWLQAQQDRRALEVAARAVAEGYPPHGPELVRARVLFREGSYALALALAEAQVRGRPDIPGLVLVGEVALTMGDRPRAEVAFTEAVRIFNAAPEASPEERLLAARAGRLNRDPYGAVKHLGALQSDHPWMVRAHFELGEVFREHYQTGDAADEYRAGLKVRPRSPLLRASLALALAEEGKLSAAVAEARSALEGDPDQPRAWQVLAMVAARKEDWEAALQAVRRTQAANPHDPGSLALEAEVLLRAGRRAEAEEAGRRCLAVNPHFAELDLAFGRAALSRRAEAEAIEHFTRGLGRDPRCAPCLFERGETHMKAGRLAPAREDLEAARYLDPFMVRAVNFLKILDRFEVFSHVPLHGGVLATSPYGPSAVSPTLRRALDAMLADLTRDLDHALGEAVRVEVFGDEQWMNARALGLGVEFGAGFSFGRCLTFAVGPTHPHSMAWTRTMRHELVHTFNADRVAPAMCPAWFTEGLATFMEGPREERANGILKAARCLGELSSLRELIRWGYTSKKTYQHYMQGAVAIEWLLSRTGPRGFNQVLDRFRAGDASVPALEAVLGEGIEALEVDYARFLEAAVDRLPGDLEFRFPSPARAAAAARGEVPARLAQGLFLARTGSPAEARALVEGLPGPEAARVRARALFAERAAGAEAALEEAGRLFPGDYGLALELGMERLRDGDRAGARAALERAHALHPGGRRAAALLAQQLAEQGDIAARAGVLERLLAADRDHAWAARELAGLRAAEGRLDEAARLLEQALGVDATHPDLWLRLARVRAAQGKPDRARAAYAGYVGVSRLGVGPARLGAAIPDPLKTAPVDPGADGGPVPPPAPPAGAGGWLEPVTRPARGRDVPWLVGHLAQEEGAAVAMAGLADALGRELAEWGSQVHLDVVPGLRRALHGEFGARAARAAAIQLGRARYPEAAGFLMAARGVGGEEGPEGEGEAREAVLEALEALAVRPRENLEPWWQAMGSQSADEWFRSSLAERGYPDAPEVEDGALKLLTVVLEDEAWYRAHAAHLRLSRALGVRAGRGGFEAGTYGLPGFASVRTQAVTAFKRVLKERHLGRRSGGGSP